MMGKFREKKRKRERKRERQRKREREKERERKREREREREREKERERKRERERYHEGEGGGCGLTPSGRKGHARGPDRKWNSRSGKNGFFSTKHLSCVQVRWTVLCCFEQVGLRVV
jgi:hypothetical protein